MSLPPTGPEADAPAPLPAPFAAALVALASGAVLVLEILGVRLLAPYVGLTLETTTSIIGVVLGGIAAGAAIGGAAADRTAARPLLATLFVVGGLLALTIVPLVRAVGPQAAGSVGGTLMLTILALLPAATVLSAVTPVTVRLQLRELETSGSVVGRLSAWATAGALAGTFGTGFVIVPLLPVSVAVAVLGAGLTFTGLALAVRARTNTTRRAALLAVGTLAAALLPLGAGTPCDAETTYHCARVVADPDRAGGNRLVLDDLVHSYVDLDDPQHLELTYVRWLADAIDGHLPGTDPIDAVFVGGGGLTLPRWLLATRPGSTARVLEVDAELYAFVREQLPLPEDPGLTVEIGDARRTLTRAATASSDLIVGDAFGGRAVPWHLATAEWMAEVRRVLRPDGLYALNLIDQPPLALLRAQAATLLDEFADVRLVRDQDGGNFVLLASDRPLAAGVGSTDRGARTLARQELAAFARGGRRLTDDDAPADQLLSAR